MKGNPLRNITGFLVRQDRRVLYQSELLHQLLIRVRYEGGFTRAENISGLKRCTRELSRSFYAHQRVQEKIIFPYLTLHIPRQEIMIHFLQSEHQTIEGKIKRFQGMTQALSDARPVNNFSEIYDRGVLLVFLLRYHLQFENQNILSLIRSELRPSERAEIALRVGRSFRIK